VLTLLVGRQAGHPVTCKNLCPLILHCFDAVGGWVIRKVSPPVKYSLQHPLLSRRQLAKKWPLKWCMHV